MAQGGDFPRFTRNNVEGWIKKMDQYLANKGLKEEPEKYGSAMLALDDFVSACMPEFDEPKYTNMKNWLRRRYGLSREMVLSEIIRDTDTEELPTTKLERMLAATPKAQHDNPLLRQLFIEKLPAHIQDKLALLEDNTSIKRLAEIADKLMARHTSAKLVPPAPTPPVAAV